MAKYTIELRNVIILNGLNEVKSYFTNYNIEDYLLPSQIEKIDFNMWNKDKLAQKIIDHYYMREIGYETIALFKHFAKVTMQEIMERYLPLIYTKFLEYDPLVNIDYTEEFERNIEGSSENSGNSNSSSSNNAEGLNILNDTPQTNISKQDIETGAYASNVNQSESSSSIENETNVENNGSSTTDENYTRRVHGNNGAIITNQRLVQEFRQTIVAVDEQIIKELNKLFMSIY